MHSASETCEAFGWISAIPGHRGPLQGMITRASLWPAPRVSSPVTADLDGISRNSVPGNHSHCVLLPLQQDIHRTVRHSWLSSFPQFLISILHKVGKACFFCHLWGVIKEDRWDHGVSSRSYELPGSRTSTCALASWPRAFSFTPLSRCVRLTWVQSYRILKQASWISPLVASHQGNQWALLGREISSNQAVRLMQAQAMRSGWAIHDRHSCHPTRSGPGIGYTHTLTSEGTDYLMTVITRRQKPSLVTPHLLTVMICSFKLT